MDPYTTIKEAIIIGKYEPGKRLTEEWLANELNVSRTPIREAIKQLEYDGLVTPLKRGVSVRTFTQKDVKQIYDLRALLEGYVASQAALYRSAKDLSKLSRLNELYSEIFEKKDDDTVDLLHEIVNINHQFHEALITASKNEHIKFHVSKVVVLSLVFRSFHSYEHHQLQASLNAHQTILEAIKNRDIERARAAMHEHIYIGRDQVLMHLEDNSIKENNDD